MDLPNTDHDEEARQKHLRVLRPLPPPFSHVERAIAAPLGPADDKVQHHHAEHRDPEPEEALPPDHADGVDGRPLEQPLLQHELRGREHLRPGDHEHAHDGEERVGPHVPAFRLLLLLLFLLVRPDGPRQPDDGHAQHDAHEGHPLEEVQPAPQEEHAEQADEEDERPARHLVDGGGDQQEAGVHERGPQDVTDGREREQQDPEAPERLVAGRGFPVLVLVPGRVQGVRGVYTRRVIVVVVVDVVVVVVVIAVSLRLGGMDRLVPGVWLLGDVALPQGHEPHDEPAAHLAEEHLGGLDDGLLEVGPLLGVGVVAVSYALVVLDKAWVQGQSGCMAYWVGFEDRMVHCVRLV